MYSSKILCTNSNDSSYLSLKAKWSFSRPFVPCLKSGLTLVSANEWAGVSISGTIPTP